MIEKYENKHTLPCMNFISTGCCNYLTRCYFIHDPRISSKNKNNFRTPKSPNTRQVNDLFFWPPQNNLSLDVSNYIKYEPIPENEQQLWSQHLWISFINNNDFFKLEII